MYGPHSHLLAIGRLLVDSLSQPWQSHSPHTTVVTPSQKHIKSQMLTHKHSHYPTATCLAWPGTPKGAVTTQPDVFVVEELKETLG